MANYKNLIVWQKADKLAFAAYKITEDFPKTELFGMVSQLRRAALSVPTNIVEGYNRRGSRELNRFMEMSLGSLAEVEYLLDFSKRLGYIKAGTVEIDGLIAETGRLLWSFKAALKSKELKSVV